MFVAVAELLDDAALRDWLKFGNVSTAGTTWVNVLADCSLIHVAISWLDFGIKVQRGRDKINLTSQRRWDAVFLTGYVGLASLLMLVNVVFGFEQILRLINGGVEIQPSETLRVVDAVVCDSV